MPMVKLGEADIYYEVSGSGFPVLLLAAGANDSKIEFWRLQMAERPYMFDPIEELSPHFTLVAMDQRNAGRSTGPMRADDDWRLYARDHLALMDRLGFKRFHILGACIGGSFILQLCKTTPERLAGTIALNPIGVTSAEGHKMCIDYFDGWADALVARRDDLDLTAVKQFGRNLYEPDFAFSVPRSFMKECKPPLLVLPGHDVAHPTEIAEDMARLAPRGELLADWKAPGRRAAVIGRVISFLQENTPV